MIKDFFAAAIINRSWQRFTALFLTGLVCAGIVYSAIADGDFIRGKDAAAFTGRPGEKITTMIVEERELSGKIEVLGQVVFREKVNISSKVSGRLKRINLYEGQRVKKGELIAEIERLPLEISLKQQEAELDISKKALELAEAKYSDALKGVEIKLKSIEKARAEMNDKKVSFDNMDNILKNKTLIYKAGGISERELKNIKTEHTSLYTRYELAKADYEIQQVGYRDIDITLEKIPLPSSYKDKIEIFKKLNTKIEAAEVESARSRVKQAENNLLSTEIMLEETYIRSPLSGIVALCNMETGEMVREDSVITTVIDISSIYVSMNINERDLLAVKKGQRISFSADAFEDKKFSAIVETLSPVLDVKSRTAEVKAISANSEGVLLPGMFVRGLIETGVKEQGIVIPSAAVLKKDDGRCEVYVVKNNIVFRTNVVKGDEIEGETRIIEGLSSGDIIITNGLNSVYQGMRIDD